MNFVSHNPESHVTGLQWWILEYVTRPCNHKELREEQGEERGEEEGGKEGEGRGGGAR